MLHSAHGVDISGGQFTTVHGPQTTILISTGQQPHSELATVARLYMCTEIQKFP